MDLSLISIEDLSEELMNRSSCGIIHLKSLKEDEIYFNWVGPHYEALGHCTNMQNIISREKDA